MPGRPVLENFMQIKPYKLGLRGLPREDKELDPFPTFQPILTSVKFPQERKLTLKTQDWSLKKEASAGVIQSINCWH